MDEKGDIFIIDFVDALVAPSEYELAAIICELFRFDKFYMEGYFGKENIEDITKLCLKGLLIHDFGSNIIRDNLGNINEITSIRKLEERLDEAVKN